MREFRPHLIDIRAEVEKAEIDLQTQFDQDPVDQGKANQAIDHLIAARSDLTRTLSELSLRLRTVLTAQQWQELQRRRPLRGAFLQRKPHADLLQPDFIPCIL
jgi:Spy/CpxP family protein refolding chaperone